MEFFKKQKINDLIQAFGLNGKRCPFYVSRKQIDAIVCGTSEAYFFFKDGARRHFAKDCYAEISKDLTEDFVSAGYKKICSDGTIIEFEAKIRNSYIKGLDDKGSVIVTASNLLHDNEMFEIRV